MSASENLKRLSPNGNEAANGAEIGPIGSLKRQILLSSEKSTDNFRVSGGCADLP